MGIFSRLGDIINSNFNALLEKAEDPEKIIRLMIQEMEDTLVEVRSAAAKTIAEKKDRNRQIQLLEQDLLDWERKAELALEKNREDLAKAALVEKARVAEQVESLRRELVLLSEQLDKLNDDIGKLQAKLDDAKTRQRSIVMRHANAKTELKARRHIHSERIDEVLTRFDYAERRIDSVESQIEALELGRKQGLAAEFSKLEHEDKVCAELDALKQRVAARQRERS